MFKALIASIFLILIGFFLTVNPVLGWEWIEDDTSGVTVLPGESGSLDNGVTVLPGDSGSLDTPSQPAQCSFNDSYTECGTGQLNSSLCNKYPADHVVKVTRNANTSCQYFCEDLGRIEGQCGATSQVSQPVGAPAAQTIAVPGSFDGGRYTNVCGSGTAANSYSCSANCNPQTGVCSGPNTVKFVCDGLQTECGGRGGAPFSETTGASQAVNSPNPGCNKTVQVDVFNKSCRDGAGNWVCSESDLTGYLVWYSGSCSVPVAPAMATVCGRQITVDDLRNQLRGAGYPGPYDNLSQMTAAYERAACPVVVPPTPTPTVVVPPTPTPTSAPVVTPTPTHRLFSACGVTGTLMPGFRALSPADCGPNQFLSVTRSGGFVVPICSLVPLGAVKTSDGCGFAPIVATPTPGVIQSANSTSIVRCPDGTVGTISGSTIVCVSQSMGGININNNNTNNNVVNPPQVVLAAAPAAELKTPVSELPRTGVAEIIWTLGGLAPAGMFMRRFGTSGGVKSANYFWQIREFLKN